jgi:transposase
MAKPYSNDLRERMIEAIEEGATREEAAERHPCEAEFASNVEAAINHGVSYKSSMSVGDARTNNKDAGF